MRTSIHTFTEAQNVNTFSNHGKKKKLYSHGEVLSDKNTTEMKARSKEVAGRPVSHPVYLPACEGEDPKAIASLFRALNHKLVWP